MAKAAGFVGKAWAYLKREGVGKTLARVVRPSSWKKGPKDVRAEYAFVQAGPVGERVDPATLDPMTVNWVMPPFPKGSGGHQNICRFIYMLEKRGYRCCIVVTAGAWFGTPEEVRARIREWFFPVDASVVLGIENAPPAYTTVATAWMTAYDVRRFRPTVHRCYFVQDLEYLFFPAGSATAFCEATYRFGFKGITAGGWLAKKLAADYDMKTAAVGFSCDRQIYNPRPRQDMRRRVFFYGRPSSERRAFELGIMALEQVAKAHPDVEIVFAGGELKEYLIPFQHRCVGVLDFEGLAKLYSECDVAMVLSMTNLSLLPLELMACGVPVVSNRAPCTQWLLSDDIAQLAEPSVEGLAQAVCEVLEDPKRRDHLRAAGLQAAASTSWEAEGDKLAAILASLRQAGTPADARAERLPA
ncbi:MAG: glycosyltransferase family 4 protein [Rhizobacter sp.]|nr:glycosyltransferase family 4 protein [Rhizobacter sp.]